MVAPRPMNTKTREQHRIADVAAWIGESGGTNAAFRRRVCYGDGLSEVADWNAKFGLDYVVAA